ncbi:MarR family transcriptional regulator [Saccharibacillus sp. CPCC 101409]|uniref:MarR family winged helix-turn-helix transcriptional regulator n=1 Tax=Saccharibacillus sp. CPCC 101409 TaxID=3058041 RepID=UPI00267337B5|nr:MarR family transcriptional regulator [Saccharibacillus sp. CPCC 101409]MDO3410110.1 MarR family transcriptional regulator [Saccharibacillus sp. CPCC 101409]
METKMSPLARELMIVIRRFRHGGKKRSGPMAGRKQSEGMLLMVLRRKVDHGEPGIMVSEISRILDVKSPTVTQLIKGLESDGLVERTADPADRRAVRISLTDEGVRVTDSVIREMESMIGGLTDYLGENDTRQLIQLLNRTHDYFAELDKNPDPDGEQDSDASASDKGERPL